MTARALLRKISAESTDSCIDWPLHRNLNGYGRLRPSGHRKSTLKMAHRMAYEIHVGDIPAGMLVCHSCDNPACVNPKHLWVGTHRDNMADRDAKGRQANRYGERNPKSKLDRENVAVIRARLKEGESQRVIAEDFGVSRGAIKHIKSGRNWPEDQVNYNFAGV